MKEISIKATLISLSLLSSTVATDQLYTGVSIGKLTAVLDLERNYEKGALQTDASNRANNAANFGAFFGYDHLIDETPLFVGIEAGGNVYDVKINRTQSLFKQSAYNINSKSDYNVFVALKLGIVIKDLSLYAKVGPSFTNWSCDFICNNNGTVQNILKKSTRMGTEYGAGIDYRLNKNWSLGIDHTFKTSPSLSATFSSGIPVTFKFTPAIHTTNLRLIYRF